MNAKENQTIHSRNTMSKNGLDFYVDFCVPMIPLISISK